MQTSTLRMWSLLGLFGLLQIALSPCQAGEIFVAKIVIDDAPLPRSNTVVHEVACQDSIHRIVVERESEKVRWELGQQPIRTADFSATPFGVAMLSGIYGKFRFSCPDSGINIHFFGFLPRRDGKKIPVTYRITIDSTGKVVRDSGLEKVDREEVDIFLSR